MKNKTQKRIEEVKKKMRKLKDFVTFYGQSPTLTKDNWKEFLDYVGCEAKLQATKQTLQEVNERGEKIISKWIQDVNDSEIILELKKDLGMVGK